VIVRSRAPLRISFAGGGTDVEPYLSEQGGCVLNATIDKYCYASLEIDAGRQITVHSLDYDVVAKYQLGDPLPDDGKLDLVKAVLKRLNANFGQQGLTFYLHTDAPPGSGLGSSSAMVVALLDLFKHWQHLPLTSYDVASLAYQVERQDVGIQGGKQDQYAATFGGFNFIEFTKDATIVNPLRIDADIVNELEYCLLLCYTGETRLSGRIIESQVARYVQQEDDVPRVMGRLKEIAVALKNALLRGKLDEFGTLLHDAWISKRQLSTAISNPHIDELYKVARQNGAVGGKISGAGGGGFMFFYTPFQHRHRVAAALEQLGAQVVSFRFEPRGVQTWTVP
jgi:D-glycero-alpha-D-manno-heptose-7-phosphate kinase